jgi:hypothetical protein
LLAALLVIGGGRTFGPRLAVAQGPRRIEGHIEYEAIGSGAASLGLASMVLGESAMALNLGRLLRGLHTLPLPSGGKAVSVSERCNVAVTFVLKPGGTHRFVLERLTLDVLYRDATRIRYDPKAHITDDLRAVEHLSWEGGRWQGAGTGALPRPRIDLVLRGAPGTPGATYRLEVWVPYALLPQGRSVWVSPMGGLEVVADGGGGVRLVRKTPKSIEAAAKMSKGHARELYDAIASAMDSESTFDEAYPVQTLEETLEGAWTSPTIQDGDAFLLLSGASAAVFWDLGDLRDAGGDPP